MGKTICLCQNGSRHKKDNFLQDEITCEILKFAYKDVDRSKGFNIKHKVCDSIFYSQLDINNLPPPLISLIDRGESCSVDFRIPRKNYVVVYST